MVIQYRKKKYNHRNFQNEEIPFKKNKENSKPSPTFYHVQLNQSFSRNEIFSRDQRLRGPTIDHKFSSKHFQLHGKFAGNRWMERRRDVRDVKTSDRLRMSSWEYRANEIRLPCCGKTLGNPVIGFWVDWPREGGGAVVLRGWPPWKAEFPLLLGQIFFLLPTSW